MTQSFMYITLTPRKNFVHIPSFNIPHISSIYSKLEWNLNKCNVMLEQMTSKHARLSNDPNDCQQLRNIMVLICFCIIVVVSCFILLLLIWNALKINEKIHSLFHYFSEPCHPYKTNEKKSLFPLKRFYV